MKFNYPLGMLEDLKIFLLIKRKSQYDGTIYQGIIEKRQQILLLRNLRIQEMECKNAVKS